MSPQDAGAAPQAPNDGWSAARPPRWTPLELVAMVLGFVVFWPIGLAILGWKFWQRRSGYSGDLRSFADERMDQMRSAFPFGCGARRGMMQARQDWVSKRWGAFESTGFGFSGPTGNRAFDDWKTAELARIEEERRKLHEAEREFAEYQGHLRQARDKEEFERFVSERDAARARGEAGWRPFPDASGERPA